MSLRDVLQVIHGTSFVESTEAGSVADSAEADRSTRGRRTHLDFHELTDRLERIYSRRLALRQVSVADAWPLFQATRNPLFNKHLLWDRPDTEQDVLNRVDAIVEASRRGRMTALSGVVKTTGEWASLFRFQPHATDPLAMEMGVWIHDRFWHGRYSLELGRMCVDAAFESCDVDRLIGASAPDNRGSCHLMRSVGMSDAKLVTRPTESGRVVELQEFELLRCDWEMQQRDRAASSTYSSVVRASGLGALGGPSVSDPVAAEPETRLSGEQVEENDVASLMRWIPHWLQEGTEFLPRLCEQECT